MTPVLSILVPTIPGRRDYLAKLLNCLAPQLSAAVKVVTHEAPPNPKGGPTIGERRQFLLEQSDSPFVCFVDDDDLVSPDYCDLMLRAIKDGADVVGFRLRQYTDGALTGLTIHSLNCRRWSQAMHEDGLFRYERTPNHLNPVRRDLAIQIGYPPMNMGEDANYSTRLYERFGTTMKEVFVDSYVYDYLYRNRCPEYESPYDENGRLTRAGQEQAIANGGSVMVNGKLCTKIEQLRG